MTESKTTKEILRVHINGLCKILEVYARTIKRRKDIETYNAIREAIDGARHAARN